MKGIIKLCILLGTAIAFAACAHQSPGAKVSNVVNVSIMPPMGVPTL